MNWKLLLMGVMVSGCSAMGPQRERLPAPPPSLTAPCPMPVALPERALSMTEIELYWGRDRGHLRQCGEQLAGLVGWANQDAGLSQIEQKAP
jgi:hypothetical protein